MSGNSFFKFAFEVVDFWSKWETAKENVSFLYQKTPVQNAEHYVVGGLQGKSFSYPYVVSIQKNNIHHCGGTLIDSTTILTAAHCFVNDTSILKAQIHRHDLTKTPEQEQGQVFNIIKIINHPDFDKDSFAGNDIALWKLNSTCNLPKYVQLPKSELNVTTDKYKEGLIVGWGRSKSEDPNPSTILLQSKLPIVPYEKCKNDFTYELNPKIHICAGFTESIGNPCHGDSGGPLFWFNENGEPIELGLVSFGSDGNCTDTPTVFTNISKYLKWINDNK